MSDQESAEVPVGKPVASAGDNPQTESELHRIQELEREVASLRETNVGLQRSLDTANLATAAVAAAGAAGATATAAPVMNVTNVQNVEVNVTQGLLGRDGKDGKIKPCFAWP